MPGIRSERLADIKWTEKVKIGGSEFDYGLMSYTDENDVYDDYHSATYTNSYLLDKKNGQILKLDTLKNDSYGGASDELFDMASDYFKDAKNTTLPDIAKYANTTPPFDNKYNKYEVEKINIIEKDDAQAEYERRIDRENYIRALDKAACGDPYMESVFDKEEIDSYITINNPVSPEAGNINYKGKDMAVEQVEQSAPQQEAQTQEAQVSALKPITQEKAFYKQVQIQDTILKGLETGTLCCLPGKDGYADTEPAVNIANGTRYHGDNLLYLKEVQKKHNYPTAEFATEAAIRQAGVSFMDAPAKLGVTLTVNKMNEDTGKWEANEVKLYNVAETKSPKALREWAAEQLGEKIERQREYLQKTHGDAYKPQSGEKKEAPEIKCTSTEPEKYLGQYLAAVSMGGKFKAEPEQAAEFSKNLETSLLGNVAKNGYPNPFNITKICNAANAECKNVIKTVRQEQSAEKKLEQQQQKTQGRGL